MEKQDLKTIERELSDIKTYLMAQAQIQKEILMEIKNLRRDYGNFRLERLGKDPKRKPK